MREAMLIVHFLGLAMGVGTSFAFMFVGIKASKMETEKGKEFQMNSFSLARMGHIGLALLVLSGGYLATPYWSNLGEYPLFITKLILVVALGAIIGILSSKAKKAIAANDDAAMQKLATFGKLNLLIGLAIVVLAVLNFH